MFKRHFTSLFAGLITTALAALSLALPQTSHAFEVRLIGPAVSWHASTQDAPLHPDGSRHWSQTNPSLGLSLAWREADGDVFKVNAMRVRDSYGVKSYMAGAAYQWRIAKAGSVTVDAGLTAGVWYRGVWANDDDYTVRKHTIAYVLPALSIEHSPTGLGLDLAIVPPLRINGRVYVPTTTAMVQLTWRFY